MWKWTLESVRTGINVNGVRSHTMDKPKVTAKRDQLGAFAPQLASLYDDVPFGQVWS